MTALGDIGDSLSLADFAETLYPTLKMKDTIVTLNCHIITFLLRALDWYEATTVSRAIQSVTRPAALRYDDVIDIQKTIRKVTDLSVAGSQAEQRDMRNEFHQIRDSQNELKSDVQSRLKEMQHQLSTMIRQQHQEREFQAIHRQLRDLAMLVKSTQQNQASAKQTLLQELVLMKQDIKATQVDILHQLSGVQLVQALSFMATSCSIDHKTDYEHALLLRRARKISATAKCAPFWNTQQLQSWDQYPANATIVLKAAFRDCRDVRDFCINVIEQLLHSEVAVVWVLKGKETKHNIFQVIKSLIAQALTKDTFSHTHVMISSHIRAFNAAHSLDDYATLLASVLTHFKLVYIVTDTAAISSESADEFHRVFAKVPQLLLERSPDTVLKVMLVVSGLNKGFTENTTQKAAQPHMALRVNQTSKKKGKRIPKSPLRGASKSGLKH